MTLSRTADLIAASPVLAFNVITLEHAEGIVAGADRAGTGVLLQLSENAIRFHGGRMTPVLAACRALADAASVPIALHLDHIQDAALVSEGIETAPSVGVSSIMVDAAHLEYDENVAATAAAAASAHAAGLFVEAELGAIGGKDGAHAPGVRTDPDEAVSFVAATGVDALAVAVGSSHAMTSRDAALDLDLIAALREALDVPLVLHGSSGVPDEVIRAAVAAGIRKVNVGTALNVGFTSAVRSVLAADDRIIDPRKYIAPGRDSIANVVEHLCGVLGR